MFICFLKVLFWFILFISGFALIEVSWRFIIAFWKLYKTKFPFAKKGYIPFIGHLNLIQSGQCPFSFSNLSSEKTFCAFRGTHPCLVTSDPKLIKQICIKYANYFHSRMIDPLSPNPYESPHVHVFGARGHRWKRIRTITSFSLSTVQLRKMLPLILEQTDDFIYYLSNFSMVSSFSSQEIDIHSLFQQLTAAVIGRCALGLEKNSFENPPKHLKFFKQVFGPEPTVSVNFETFQWIIPTTTKFFASISAIICRSKTPIDKLNDFIRGLLSGKESGNKNAVILQNLKQYETLNSSYLNIDKHEQSILNFESMSKSDKIYTDVGFLRRCC